MAIAGQRVATLSLPVAIGYVRGILRNEADKIMGFWDAAGFLCFTFCGPGDRSIGPARTLRRKRPRPR